MSQLDWTRKDITNAIQATREQIAKHKSAIDGSLTAIKIYEVQLLALECKLEGLSPEPHDEEDK